MRRGLAARAELAPPFLSPTRPTTPARVYTTSLTIGWLAPLDAYCARKALLQPARPPQTSIRPPKPTLRPLCPTPTPSPHDPIMI